MHLDLDELMFLVVFLAFNVFMFGMVDGILAKLFFAYWFVSVLGCGVYVIHTRDNEDKETIEDFTTYTEADPNKETIPK